MIKCSNCSNGTAPAVVKLNTDPPSTTPTYEMPKLIKQIPYDQMLKNAHNNLNAFPQMLADEGLPEVNLPPASEMFTNAPIFAVPINPLLPEGYQEMLSYNDIQYLNGFLRTQIGKMTQVEFLIGSNTMVIKTGILMAVGINYIILKETETGAALACDFYTIKFITFY